MLLVPRIGAAPARRFVPVAIVLVVTTMSAADAWSQQMIPRGTVCCPPTVQCPPSSIPSATPPSPGQSTGQQPMDGSAQQPDSQAQQPQNDLANQMMTPDQAFSAAGGTSSSVAQAPGTIGDFFGTFAVPTQYTNGAFTLGPGVGVGNENTKLIGPYSAVAGRQKLVEHDNPIPRDRAFINYSYFGDVPLTQNPINVNRITFGVEKTFFDGVASIEVRLPTASTLDSDLLATPVNQLSHDTNYELGNVNLAGKVLLVQTENTALSVGSAVTLPTADDVRIFGANGVGTYATPQEILRYENEAIHVLPFVGLTLIPTDRTFFQFLGQLDFDTNGNSVYAQSGVNGPLVQIGRANDANFAYASATLGYWLTREMNSRGVQAGIAPLVELHYNKSIRDFDTLTFNNGAGTTVGIGTRRPGIGANGVDEVTSFEALNVTLGVYAQCSPNCSITAGYCSPLAGPNAKDQFNGEARVMLNYFFGNRTGYFSR